MSTDTLPPHSVPKPAPRPAPRPRMSLNSPSAPPAEGHQGAEGGPPVNDGYPSKRQSQLVSPNAFSYAPGLFFSQSQLNNGPGTAPAEPGFSGSRRATAPYPPEIANSMPTLLIIPPDYGNSTYPQGRLVITVDCTVERELVLLLFIIFMHTVSLIKTVFVLRGFSDSGGSETPYY